MEKTRSMLARITLMAACAALPLAGLGCDGEQAKADKRAEAQFRVIAAELNKGAKGNPQVVRDALEKIARDGQAFDGVQLAAKARIAQDDYAAVVALLPQLTSREAKVTGFVSKIDQLAARIAADMQAIAAYSTASPEAAIKAYEAEPLKAAKENLAKANEQIKKLTAEISTKEAEIASLRKTQAAAMDRYTSLKAQSEKATGSESVKLYTEAMAAWAEAEQAKAKLQPSAELKVAGLAGEVVSAREALKAAQNDKAMAEESIKLAQAQMAQLKKAWDETKAAIAAREASIKAAAGEQGIAGLTKTAAAELAATESLRKTVLEKCEKAAQSYETAAAAATKLNSLMTQRISLPANSQAPGRKAWEEVRRTQSPAIYQLGQARLLQRIGQLHLNQRTLLMQWQQVATGVGPALKKASVALAPELVRASLAQEIKDASSKAEAALTAADAIFTEIAANAQGSEKTEAAVGHAITRYAMYQIKKQTSLLNEAKNQLKELLGSEDVTVALPALADDLETRNFAALADAAAKAAAKPAPAPVPEEQPAKPAEEQPKPAETPAQPQQ